MANSTTDDLKQLLLNRNFILITLINFLIMLGDYQYFVTSALFSLKLFNAHLSEAGFISGLMVVGCFIGRFLTGNLINLLVPKKTLIIGAVSTLLSTLCSLVAFNLVIFGFERFWFGFSIGMLSTATGTIIAYCLNASMQGFGISIFSLSTALSLALGPFIALEVYQNFGVSTVDVEVNVLCALGLMACFLIKNPPHLAKANTSFFKISNYIDFRVLKFATTALIIPIGYGCISAYLAAMCEERQIADAAGLFFLVGAFVTILSRPVFGRLFDKFGDVSCHYLCLVKPFNPCYGKFCVFSGDLSYFPWLRFK